MKSATTLSGPLYIHTLPVHHHQRHPRSEYCTNPELQSWVITSARRTSPAVMYFFVGHGSAAAIVQLWMVTSVSAPPHRRRSVVVMLFGTGHCDKTSYMCAGPDQMSDNSAHFTTGPNCTNPDRHIFARAPEMTRLAVIVTVLSIIIPKTPIHCRRGHILTMTRIIIVSSQYGGGIIITIITANWSPPTGNTFLLCPPQWDSKFR